MKQICALLLPLALVFTYSLTAKAELINRGSGFVYDTDLDITWLQDANYARTSGYTTEGFTYDEAMT